MTTEIYRGWQIGTGPVDGGYRYYGWAEQFNLHHTITTSVIKGPGAKQRALTAIKEMIDEQQDQEVRPT